MNFKIRLLFMALLCLICAESLKANNPLLVIPFGYDYVNMGRHEIHFPVFGVGYLTDEKDKSFTDIEKRFLILALYRPFFFKEEPLLNEPKNYHQIDALFDVQMLRHQYLLIFKASSDKPITGGLSTFQAGLGWGYELVRKENFSFILGGALGVSDFGINTPSGKIVPVLPLPLIRLKANTNTFSSSFDFLTGPVFSCTILPKKKIRLTSEVRMDYYRSMNDIISEFTTWYRPFGVEESLGDFAGVGVGFKNDSVNTFISNDKVSFEVQQSSLFAVFDLSILKIEYGKIIKSRFLIDEETTGKQGKGYYVSIQGVIPLK